MTALTSHLKLLEAESIHIFREAAAQFRAPVLLYSIGKDSTVLLHLARKAFWPAKPPFPILHVDTTWKFHDMIAFRDKTVRDLYRALPEPFNLMFAIGNRGGMRLGELCGFRIENFDNVDEV